MTEQLTVKRLIDDLSKMDSNLPVYFRRVSAIAGNIEQAASAELSTASFFGIVEPVVIIEPFKD